MACTNPSSDTTSGTPTPSGQSKKEITSFEFDGLSCLTIIEHTTGTIIVTVPNGTDLATLVPRIVHTGESLSPPTGSAMDFSSDITFTVTAKDGTAADYKVTVMTAPSTAKSITDFRISATAGVIDEATGTITIEMPQGTDISQLTPSITHTGISISPASGFEQDFTSPVSYSVTAENLSTRTYQVSVTVLPSYTVTFDSRGGSPVDSQSVPRGTSPSEPVCPDKDGDGFEGWFKEDTLDNKWDFAADSVTQEITLYAKWHDGTAGLSYQSINGSEYGVSGGTTDGLTAITIPSYWKGKPVTAVNGSAFEDYSDLETIDMPEGIERIGDEAFRDCFGLTALTIPDSVREIGERAFRSCNTITTVTIPANVETMGLFCFENCTSLTSAEILPGLTTMENGIFDYCYKLTEVTLPDTITYMGACVFQDCYGLEEITLPPDLTFLGERAFQGCTALKNLHVPVGVPSIGYRTFYDCDNLASVELSEGLLTIGDEAFRSAFNLSDITIPSTVTTIGSYTFSRCLAIEEITIPAGVTIIRENAFSNCLALRIVTIMDNPLISTDDMMEIEGSAFYNCTALTSINVPDSVTTLGSQAFSKCSSLASINIPAGITEIDNWTFSSTPLTSVTIPAGVTSIEYSAFSGCYDLKELNMLPETAPTLGSYVFSNVEDCALHLKSSTTGYDVSPWTDTATFSSVTQDL